MKSSFSIKIVIWVCNITLILLAVSFLVGSYYFTKMPSLLSIDYDLAGVESTSFQVSQSFLGDNYLYERVVDREKGIDEENYYFASNRNIYRVSFSDSLAMQADKINHELSSSESKYFGIVQKSNTVSESVGDVLVRYAAPAISVEKDAFISYARSNVISLLLAILYGSIFIWYLRKFIFSLREPGFFYYKKCILSKDYLMAGYLPHHF